MINIAKIESRIPDYVVSIESKFSVFFVRAPVYGKYDEKTDL